MTGLYDLQETLCTSSLLDRTVSLRSRYERAIKNQRVREILYLETPPITDLTDMLGVEKGGRIYAVRMDLHRDVDNHKKPVVAGLILRGVLQGKIPKEDIDTFIDGGNFNSAKAVKFYAKRFGMKGMYVMSGRFPQHMIDLLQTDAFTVLRAPFRYDNAREREFYEYLFELMQDRDFRKNKFCLWHAKYGGEVMYPLGKQISENFEESPDYVVSCLGAGSTLEGLQIAMRDYFEERGAKKVPQIVVAEHELSPLFAKFLPMRLTKSKLSSLENIVVKDEYYQAEGVPHIVIGPHYDEINPLLAKDSINRIASIVQYSENDWKSMQQYLRTRGLSIGNSSAANISVAARLANEGHKVVTVIFEPFREFYRKREEIASVPWILRYKTSAQKVAALVAIVGSIAASIYYVSNVNPNAPSFPY